MIEEKDLHPGCVLCRKTNVVENDIVDAETNTVIAHKGDFIINCKGIPKDPVEQIVQIAERKKLGPDFTRADAVTLAELRDPVLWAFKNLTVLDPETQKRGPWLPQGATDENIKRYKLDETAAYYQELMVRCTATRNVLRLGRRCLPAGEPVAMSDGAPKSIEQVEVGDLVLSKNAQNKIVPKLVTAIFKNGIQQVYLIELDNGSSIRCTANHPLLKSESKSLKWTSIEEGLLIGDRVEVVDSIGVFSLARIIGITKDGKEPTYDITVEETHNFLVNGIITHNSGKSWSICAKALHKMCTIQNYRVMVITPTISQLDVLFDQMSDFIEMSESLKPSLETERKTPQRYLEFKNGSSAIGFVSGNSGPRGQRADMIIIDECAYVDEADLAAVTAIMTEHSETILIAASTPSGAREKFFDWDQDPAYRTFHYPSMCRPKWSPYMEYEQKKENPGVKYDHEFLAIHGSVAEGVFQQGYLDRALLRGDYLYEDQGRRSELLYSIGVDWNPVNGTEVVVIEGDFRDPTYPTYKVVEAGRVFREGNTQIQALQEIIRLNRKWEPFAIYVDKGAGAMQIEMLNQFGADAENNTPDRRLEEIVKSIDFGSKIELRHPTEGTVFKEYAKPAIVENAIRCLEANQIVISSFDEELIRALRGYIITKISVNRRQVYGMINDGIPDHRLDAWLLGLFAFTMEMSKLGQPEIIPAAAFTGYFGETTIALTPFISKVDRSDIRPQDRTSKMKGNKDQQIPHVEKEHELNFIPATVIVENTRKDGIQTRVIHNVRPSKHPSSRTPVRRSQFR